MSTTHPTMNDRQIEIADRFAAAGQGHVFSFWEELDESARDNLIQQCESIDLALVAKFASGELGELPSGGVRAQAEVVGLEDEPQGISRGDALTCGEACLRAGKVGVFLVAGGQGSRLGFSGPKGCLPVGPLSNRTLFEFHAAKIVKLQQTYGATIPWYIMTSEQNDSATRAHFEEHSFFGLDPDAVFFMPQSLLPALDADGKLILADKGTLFMSPSGHGGAYEAFASKGGLADADARGLEHIFYFQVDNPLMRIADPLFLGIHEGTSSEMSLKVLEKTGPDEKIGVVALQDGAPGVVEYSDLSEEEAQRRDDNGKLVYWAGSIAIHLFKIDFMKRVIRGEIELPFHVAKKQIPTHTGEKIDGRKFETFVFDALPSAKPYLNLEVVREREFAPIKNATGVDSLDSGRELMIEEHRRWLSEVGITATGVVEISPFVAVGWKDLIGQLEEHSGRTIDADVRVELDANGKAELIEV